MRTNPILLLAMSAVALSGCSTPQGGEYFPPSRDGSRREYSFEYSDPLMGTEKGRIAYRIDGTERINGNTYFKEVAVVSGVPGVLVQTRYVRRDKDGIHVIDGEDNTKADYLETPFPVKVGSSWTVKKPKGETHYRAEAIESLQLLDRRYDRCLKLSYTGQNGQGYSYSAPGIGEVKGVANESGATMEAVLDKR